MTDLDLDRIEALADAATPGEWHAVRHYIGAGDDPTDPHTEVANVSFLNDAAFIAGTGPDVVKELVKQLREARAEIGGSRSIVAHLLNKLGGSATFTAFELAETDTDGTITRTDDPATRTITLTYRRNDE